MTILKKLVIVLIMTVVIPGQLSASENYLDQVSTVIAFHEALVERESPTVSVFFKLFGKGNEAELELILRQRFPSLDRKGKWFDNREAKTYVTKVYDNPQLYPSRFLQCLKSNRQILFADKIKRQIEFPPEIAKDFRRFTVITDGKKVIFEFSQDESYIENIYLPDGKSVYTLIEKCVKPDKGPN
jgi:hypothetical protein